MPFVAELKRRNVHRMAGLYLVGAWLLVQVASTVLPAFDLPGWLLRAVIVVLAIGLVPALAFAWVFEITPDGLRRESEIDRSASITLHTGKNMDRLIVAVLVLALFYFAVDKFVLAPRREAAAQQQTAAKVAEAHKAGRSEALVESYGEKSIAVLPFTDMSPARDQEYMGDGLAEELLNLLARIPELRVISRSSAFSFKGQNIEVPEIARRLNVAHVLEGSVRKSGNKVRITAQLIEARSDTHLWSQTWDRELDDIFAVQDEIAGAVVEQLRIKLLGETPKTRSVDPKAYSLYLRARELQRLGTEAAQSQAIDAYQQALAIDPAYAAAWVGVASTWTNLGNKGQRPIDESYRQAREAATSAVSSDPRFALAYTTLSRIASDYDGDFATAASQVQKALALEPTSTEVIAAAASLAQSLGRIEESVKLDEFLIARDPVSASGHGRLGYDYARLGRLEEGIASYREALALSPGRLGTQYNIGELLLRMGRYEAALEAMQQESSEPWRSIGLTMAWYSLGRNTESDAALAALIESYEKDAAFNIAYALAWRGEADRAFEWLDKAVAYHDTGLVEIGREPMFDKLRPDPRWLPFLRRIGKAPEQLAAIPFVVKLPE